VSYVTYVVPLSCAGVSAAHDDFMVIQLMTHDWIRATPTGTRIELRVIPRAHRDGIDGLRHGCLLVRVSAPPVERAANDAVIGLLARTLGISRSAIRIVSGEHARKKAVEVAGLPVDLAIARLRGADRK
jgi:uncharacterized protein (TIGR00251 family)